MTHERRSNPDRAEASTGKTSTETPSVEKASVKEAIGKLTGDVKVQAEGEAEKRSSKSGGKPGSARTS